MSGYFVDPDISVASTIDTAFYRDETTFALARERIFARSWQWIGDLEDVAGAGSLSPRELLPGLLDEPLLLSHDGAGTLRCLSNVCTHRGNILVRVPCTQVEQIRCGYHSRRFDLSGRMTFMPEFAGAKNFPSGSDSLPQIPFAAWANHAFAALDPAAPLEAFLGDIMTRLAMLPVERFLPDPAQSRDYVINAHWALYVENYLEGYHIPIIHPTLNASIAADYGTELEPPVIFYRATPKNDAAVAGLWAWAWPCLGVNVYADGILMERMWPIDANRTRLDYLFLFSEDADEADIERQIAASVVTTVEDLAICEAVQRNLDAGVYQTGRLSPKHEAGVAWFQRQIERAIG